MLTQPVTMDDAMQGAPNAMPRKGLYSIRPGQYLAREGEQQGYVHHIMEGWACRYKLLPDGRRQITRLFLPGDYCELCWAHGKRASQHVVALTSVRTLRFLSRDFERMLLDSPAVQEMIWSEALIHADIQDEWIINLGRKSAIEKLSHLFCEFFYRLKAVDLCYGGQCAMPLTQLDLADITGLTPVHVNRTLQEMRNLRLIELRSKWLRIPDLARLRQIAVFDDSYLSLTRRRDDPPALSAVVSQPTLGAC